MPVPIRWFAALALAAAQLSMIVPAQAQQSYLECNTNGELGSAGMCPDQGIAAAMAYGLAQYHIARGACGLSAGRVALGSMTVDMVNRKISYGIIGLNNNALCATAVRAWPANQSCADRNANKLADAGLGYSEPSSCISGCKVQGTSFTSASGPVKTYGMKDRTYTGDVCTPAATPTNDIAPLDAEKQDATKPKSQECTGLGSGQTGCVKPNGDYCATASTGKTFCWTPSETGKKTDGTEAQVKSPKGDPVTPPNTTITDQEWQRKEGHQQTSCTGTTCTTYNVTNYSSVPAGTAKNSSGDNSSDGSGNTSGNGAAAPDGKKDDSDTDSASDSGNCTTPPVCVGDTLKCLHLRYTWKTQCNTERGEVEGGATCTDGDVPVCTGKSCKAAEYAQVLQQWRQRCGFEQERAAAGRDAAAGANDAAGDDEAGEVAKLWSGDGKPSPTFDEGKVSIGGGDLLGGTVEIYGKQFTLSPQFYDALAIIKKIIIAAAILAGLWIVWRS